MNEENKRSSEAGTCAAQRLVAAFPGVLELRPRRGSDVTLIRPDGYVAYTAHNGPPIAALDTVRTLLEPQAVPKSDRSLANAS